MAIDWSRFTFLCDVDDHENVWVYPTDNVVTDAIAMQRDFIEVGELLPQHKIIQADYGHKPGIAVFFAQRLAVPLLKIAATIDRIAGKIAVESMGSPGRKRGNQNEPDKLHTDSGDRSGRH